MQWQARKWRWNCRNLCWTRRRLWPTEISTTAYPAILVSGTGKWCLAFCRVQPVPPLSPVPSGNRPDVLVGWARAVLGILCIPKMHFPEGSSVSGFCVCCDGHNALCGGRAPCVICTAQLRKLMSSTVRDQLLYVLQLFTQDLILPGVVKLEL